MNDCDIAIVGAGPYGLAAAAHLRDGGSLRVAAFGETMSFWSDRMPVGMQLRSPHVACSIADPAGDLSLAQYEGAIGEAKEAPVPLSRFVEYGRWFQEAAVPDLNRERIREISRNGNGFHVSLASGERIHAGRVVVAAGIGDFAWVPEVFRDLPGELVSHASQHDDLTTFSGARVLVIGAGQSALESAALLAEGGAQVEVAVRGELVHWLDRRWHHKLGPISRLLYAPPDVGPMGISWFVALPKLFTSTPRRTQAWMSQRALRPAGSGWLPPRLGNVTISTGINACEAREENGRVVVTFDDGATREVDHILLGTGYRVDVSRYPFLAPDLKRELDLAGGYPVLRRGFESSVPGLHFMGAPAAYSYGPLMRFVAGTTFAGKELARVLLGRPRATRG